MMFKHDPVTLAITWLKPRQLQKTAVIFTELPNIVIPEKGVFCVAKRKPFLWNPALHNYHADITRGSRSLASVCFANTLTSGMTDFGVTC